MARRGRAERSATRRLSSQLRPVGKETQQSQKFPFMSSRRITALQVQHYLIVVGLLRSVFMDFHGHSASGKSLVDLPACREELTRQPTRVQEGKMYPAGGAVQPINAAKGTWSNQSGPMNKPSQLTCNRPEMMGLVKP